MALHDILGVAVAGTISILVGVGGFFLGYHNGKLAGELKALKTRMSQPRGSTRHHSSRETATDDQSE